MGGAPHRILRHESDEEIFEVGSRPWEGPDGKGAGGPEDLYTIRHASVFHGILSRELVRTDPKEAFRTYLAQLLEGTGIPGWPMRPRTTSPGWSTRTASPNSSN